MPAERINRQPNMTELLTKHGSFRRLMEAYWQGELSIPEEREIEGAIKKELLAEFKPVQVLATLVKDVRPLGAKLCNCFLCQEGGLPI